VSVNLTREAVGGFILVGILPKQAALGASVKLTFSVPKLDTPAGSPRQLGVSIRSVELRSGS
jgi:hypothetical protein